MSDVHFYTTVANFLPNPPEGQIREIVYLHFDSRSLFFTKQVLMSRCLIVTDEHNRVIR